jgi:hypothetical protein
LTGWLQLMMNFFVTFWAFLPDAFYGRISLLFCTSKDVCETCSQTAKRCTYGVGCHF